MARPNARYAVSLRAAPGITATAAQILGSQYADRSQENGLGGGESTLKPTHNDPVVPEDHDEIKRDELEALEKEVDGLRTALGTRTLIGKAMGVIIEREGVNETEAFEILKTMSQHRNIKLRDVAARLAEEAQPKGAEEPESPS